jgi:hypothetical protein
VQGTPCLSRRAPDVGVTPDCRMLGLAVVAYLLSRPRMARARATAEHTPIVGTPQHTD